MPSCAAPGAWIAYPPPRGMPLPVLTREIATATGIAPRWDGAKGSPPTPVKPGSVPVLTHETLATPTGIEELSTTSNGAGDSAMVPGSSTLDATRTNGVEQPFPGLPAEPPTVPRPVALGGVPSAVERDARPEENDPDRALRLAIKDAVDRGNIDRAAKLLDVLRAAAAPAPQSSAPVVDLASRRTRRE